MKDKGEINQKILNIITNKRKISKSFDNIIEGFIEKLKRLNPTKNFINVEEYFGINIGKAIAKNLLLKNKIIKNEWLKNHQTKDDFKGLYVFLHDKRPFYVGISKSVIRRILQHVKGNTHNSSTLAYKIGLLKYELETGGKFDGKRKELDFKNKVEPIKAFLMKQNIAFIPIENDEDLVLFEIYCSMKFRTKLNTFETH